MKTLNRLTAVFWVLVVGIGLSFAGGVYTAVTEHQEKKERQVPADQIPLPALPETVE